MIWSQYLTGRARAAFPGVMLLRTGVDSQGSRFLDRTVMWDNWLAYRGVVWEFGGGVYTNPHFAAYTVAYPTRKLVRSTYHARLVNVRDLHDAIDFINVKYDYMTATIPVGATAVDMLPWDLHKISDEDARRVAGQVYLASTRELDV